MEYDPQKDYENRLRAIVKLIPHGFQQVEGWVFVKNDIQYDLSAADLDQIERIEKQGLFVLT